MRQEDDDDYDLDLKGKDADLYRYEPTDFCATTGKFTQNKNLISKVEVIEYNKA